MIRGAFEFQGQKSSAMSRAYIPSTIWNKVKEKYLDELIIKFQENFKKFDVKSEIVKAGPGFNDK